MADSTSTRRTSGRPVIERAVRLTCSRMDTGSSVRCRRGSLNSTNPTTASKTTGTVAR